MHNPLKMGKNGNARFALHQSNQPFATARNNHIHKFGHLQQMLNRGAITGGDDLNGVFGEACGLPVARDAEYVRAALAVTVEMCPQYTGPVAAS